MSRGFYYEAGGLSCDGARVVQASEKYGTPLYLYSEMVLRERAARFLEAFPEPECRIHYALKANSNLSLLKILREAGCWADIVSGGELQAALRAGFKPEEIAFAGVGKTDDEIKMAVESGVGLMIAESLNELGRMDRIASDTGKTQAVALRINPDIDPKTHAYISTGLRENKFGMVPADVLSGYKDRDSYKSLKLVGIHLHIGSQVGGIAPFEKAAKFAAELAGEIREAGGDVSVIDLGGGLAVDYEGMLPGNEEMELYSPKQLSDSILPIFRNTGTRIDFEPGRWIVAPAGVLVTKVLYVKVIGGKKFVVTDAGMTDFLRPSLYGAVHPMVPVKPSGRKREKVDIVGPICETTDRFASGYELERVDEGDLLALMGAGAYGYSLSSNYNLHTRPAEVMAENGKLRLIRRREDYDDLFDTMDELS